MSRIVDTGAYSKTAPGYVIYERDNIYCGLDSAVTIEVFNKLKEKADSVAWQTYEKSRRYSIIAAIMSDRGIRVDTGERIRQLFEFQNEYNTINQYGADLGEAIGVGPINLRSPDQLKHAFYRVLKVPPVMKKERGKEPRETVDEEALGKISNYLYARPLAKACLAEREIRGVLKILNSGVDSDNRMRAEFEPGSVETGRWASRKNPLNGGTNFQNITDKMRRIFIPDDGYFFAYADLEQAESRATAYYADDEAYIQACESADLHKSVVQMMWPGTDPYEIYHKHFNRRDIAKRAGHGTNYKGNPYGLAAAIGVPQAIVSQFQSEYFDAFPGIRKHHLRIAQILQSEMCLTTVFGRRRHFFERPWSDETLKEAIAHISQSTVADYLNEGLDRLFWQMDANDKLMMVRLLAQVHDAGLMLVKEGHEHLIPAIEECLSFPVTFPSGKSMTIPVKTKVGYNWAEASDDNPNGLGPLEDLKNKKLILTTLS